jgi:hypothetical protein
MNCGCGVVLIETRLLSGVYVFCFIHYYCCVKMCAVYLAFVCEYRQLFLCVYVLVFPFIRVKKNVTSKFFGTDRIVNTVHRIS